MINSKLIIALDVENIIEAEKIIIKLKDKINIFKIGYILFARYGSSIIDLVIRNGCKVFLDLKMFDIPHVVASAIKYFTEKKVYMYTISLLGGKEMVIAAVNAAQKISKELNIVPPIALGVGVLTSLDNNDLKELGIKKAAFSEAILLAKLAKQWGCDGVVAPLNLAKRIKKQIDNKFIVVSPGIRDKIYNTRDEHKNYAIIDKIKEPGADYYVVGRAIIKAKEPEKRIKDFLLN